MMTILQPPGWARPKGFSNGIAVKGGTTVYIAGQVGWTGEGVWEARDFGGQFRQTLKNTLAVLAEAGGRPEHIVRMTWYVTDRQAYLDSRADLGAAYPQRSGHHNPPKAGVPGVARMEAAAKVEIETTAVMP